MKDELRASQTTEGRADQRRREIYIERLSQSQHRPGTCEGQDVADATADMRDGIELQALDVDRHGSPTAFVDQHQARFVVELIALSFRFGDVDQLMHAVLDLPS